MSRRIIFLDIDGVLNHWSSPPAPLYFPCDPANVACFNRLVATAEAGIVVSSDWRNIMSWERLCTILVQHGVSGEFVGKTPSLDREGPFDRRPIRGHEVDLWLKEERFEGEFVILDDRGDLEPHGHRLVRTDPEVGLVEADVQRAMQLLGGATDERNNVVDSPLLQNVRDDDL